MIEINLSPSKRNQGLHNIAGINLNHLNIKLLIPFIFAVYIIEPIIESIYELDIKKLETTELKKRKEIRKYKAEAGKYQGIKKQVEELRQKEKDLESKIKIVRSIVEKRQNPFRILKYVADNTPKNVWIEELEISDQELRIVGFSTDWKDIGKFNDNLSSSLFFNGRVEYSQLEASVKSKINNDNINPDGFEMKTRIVRFE